MIINEVRVLMGLGTRENETIDEQTIPILNLKDTCRRLRRHLDSSIYVLPREQFHNEYIQDVVLLGDRTHIDTSQSVGNRTEV